MILTPSLYVYDAVSSYCLGFLQDSWCRVVVLSVSSPIEPKSRVFPPKAIQYLANGTHSRYKSCLLANGSTQLEGVDVDETFSPVVKLGTIWTCKYAIEILERASMVSCNPCRTPVDTESKLGDDGDLDPTFYRSLADYGLQLFSSSTTDLVAYSDADWAGCPTTRRSTSGYCVFLGNNLLSWSFKRQPSLSRSSVEAEYRSIANVVAETYCAMYLSSNPVQHQRIKHIEIDIHFVRDLVAACQVQGLHIPSRYQVYNVPLQGAYNPPGYDQQQYDQYYQQYPQQQQKQLNDDDE
ncbi:ribonuclease H-like domain-containing protein [Tanacetum coccineum]